MLRLNVAKVLKSTVVGKPFQAIPLLLSCTYIVVQASVCNQDIDKPIQRLSTALHCSGINSSSGNSLSSSSLLLLYDHCSISQNNYPSLDFLEFFHKGYWCQIAKFREKISENPSV